jgi:hypothetical protein
MLPRGTKDPEVQALREWFNLSHSQVANQLRKYKSGLQTPAARLSFNHNQDDSDPLSDVRDDLDERIGNGQTIVDTAFQAAKESHPLVEASSMGHAAALPLLEESEIMQEFLRAQVLELQKGLVGKLAVKRSEIANLEKQFAAFMWEWRRVSRDEFVKLALEETLCDSTTVARLCCWIIFNAIYSSFRVALRDDETPKISISSLDVNINEARKEVVAYISGWALKNLRKEVNSVSKPRTHPFWMTWLAAAALNREDSAAEGTPTGLIDFREEFHGLAS